MISVSQHISKIGHPLPVDVGLLCLDFGRNMARRLANDFEQALKSKARGPVVGNVRNACSVQYRLDVFDGLDDVGKPVAEGWRHDQKTLTRSSAIRSAIR